MIADGSRYLQGTPVRLPDNVGIYQQAVLRTVPASLPVGFSLHVWQVGDRLDIVAANVLNDSTLWWSILDLNPELIDPLNIQPGSIVRIPVSPVLGQGTLVQ